jgi:GNAT superfamily N-acetyltransferase
VWQTPSWGAKIEVVEDSQRGRAALRPAGVEDAAAIGRVHVESWRTTYPGLLPDSYLASMDAADHAGRWERLLSQRGLRHVALVAELEGEVVGFASAGPDRDGDRVFDGELYAIYLLEREQGRGVGRTLVEAAADGLAQRGMQGMRVWVLRDNGPARGFYEHLGGLYLRERTLEFDQVVVPEVSYGWPDVRRLASARV